jgi:hypothetical protein
MFLDEELGHHFGLEFVVHAAVKVMPFRELRRILEEKLRSDDLRSQALDIIEKGRKRRSLEALVDK